MRNSLRLAAVLTTALALAAPPPAHAAGAVTFTGTVNIDCFGCGVSNGRGDFCVNGIVNGRPVVCVPGTLNDPNEHADFVLSDHPNTCPVLGEAAGTALGDVDVDFAWTRVGSVAVITTSGEINGAGTATFAVTAPLGFPCSVPVTARVTGWIAGS